MIEIAPHSFEGEAYHSGEGDEEEDEDREKEDGDDDDGDNVSGTTGGFMAKFAFMARQHILPRISPEDEERSMSLNRRAQNAEWRGQII